MTAYAFSNAHNDDIPTIHHTLMATANLCIHCISQKLIIYTSMGYSFFKINFFKKLILYQTVYHTSVIITYLFSLLHPNS